MDVRLLGQVEAVDGESLPLGGPTQRRVLAALALRRNEVVSISHLVDVIWPDGEPPDRAEHNVRTYVHRLRSSLNGQDDRIETVGAGYRIRLDTEELDAARFEQLAGTASRLADTGESIAALDLVDEAEQLWSGRPVEEFEHEPWATPDAARLRELYAELRTRRASTLIELGRASDAVASLESLVRDEPLRERPRALLMRALYESGRQAEALRAFQDFRRSLVDEVGVEPSSDLAELDRSIATGALATAPDRTRSVGGYELHERIGEGAFAVVHRATQTSLEREVAVKIIRAELANRPEFIRRFEAEAQMVARVEHPSVVPLYDYWREPDRAFLVMRWMTGGSLEAQLDKGPWSVGATAEVVDQIAAALDAAHIAGVVHRDVKPGNILFDDAGRAYLGDFGIALDAEQRSDPESALSEGSPVFASPEQLRREPAGPEADVHALAIVAFTLLTGRTPFAETADEPTLLQRQLHDPIPSVRATRADLPERIDGVLAVATAKVASERYPTAPSFAAAFRAATTHADVAPGEASITLRPRSNPYKGLRAFDETDAADFHGRRRLVDELVDHLDQPDARLLAVVGPSGSGKSSVVRAGLIPALRDGRVPGSSQWFCTTMIPGARPFEALETALLRVAVNPPTALLDLLRDGDRGVLRGVKRILPDDDAVVTVTLDQFEELFTGDTSDAERDQFLRALTVAASEPGSPARFVLTLRADFYDRPLRHPDFAFLLKQHTVVVTPLAPDELEHAISAPAAAVGVGFEPGLVAEIIADVNHEPGALPLLQYALTQVFDQTTGDTISIDAYRSIGGLTGALGRRAEELWRAADAEEQLAARRLFGRLVTLGEGAEDTRRRIHLTELGGDPTTLATIDRFGEARLVTFDTDPASREPTVELAHEALIREWPRLGDWLDDDRDTLRTHHHVAAAVTGWIERDRDPNELYRGGRLDAAEPLLTSDAVALNETEREFLLAGVERRSREAAEERRRVRRLRGLVQATAVVAAAALIAGTVALVQWRRADDEADAAAVSEAQAIANAEEAATAQADARREAEQADAARQEADQRRLLASVGQIQTENPRLGLLLSAQLNRTAPSAETLSLLQEALVELPRGFEAFFGDERAYAQVSLSPDGERVGALTEDQVVVWDTTTGVEVVTVGVESSDMALTSTEVLIADDTAELLRASITDGSTRRWAAPLPVRTIDVLDNRIVIGSTTGKVAVSDSGGPWTILPGGLDAPVDRLHVDVTGHYVVATSNTNGASAAVWDLETDALPYYFGHSDPHGSVHTIDAVVVDDTIATLGPNGTMQIRSLGDPAEVPSEPFAATSINEIGDGSFLLVGESGYLSVRNADGTELQRYDGIGALGVNDVETSADGRFAALATPGGVELWSLKGGRALSESFTLAGPLESYEPTGGQRTADGLFGIERGDIDDPGVVVLEWGRPTALWDQVGLSNAISLRFVDDVAIVVLDDLSVRFVAVDGDRLTLVPDLGFSGLSGEREWAYDRHADTIALAIGGTGRQRIEVVERTADSVESLTDLPIGGLGRVGVFFSSDGRQLLVGTSEGTLSSWSTTSWEQLWTTAGAPEFVGVGAVIVDDDTVGVLTADGHILYLDIATGQAIDQGRQLSASGFPPGLVSDTLDSGHLVTVPRNGSARIWDLEARVQIGVAFPAVGESGTIYSNTELLTREGNVVHIWPTDITTWAGQACRIAGRDLTRTEWTLHGPTDQPYEPVCESSTS